MSFHTTRSIFSVAIRNIHRRLAANVVPGLFLDLQHMQYRAYRKLGPSLFSPSLKTKSLRNRARASSSSTIRKSKLKPKADLDLNLSIGINETKPSPTPRSRFGVRLVPCECDTIARLGNNTAIFSSPTRTYFPIRKMSSSAIKQFNQKFLDAAAHGNLDEFKALLGNVDKDVKSDRGWTALMFAARNGNVPIISALIEKGCDMEIMNASGQTALEIAQFWNHKEAAAILSQHKENVLFNQTHNYYSLNPLYRASDLRKDATALQTLKKDAASKFVLFEDQKPFLLPPDGNKRKYKFALFSCDQLSATLLQQSTVIFLGLETWDPSSSAWFAVNVKENSAATAVKMLRPNQVYPEGSFVIPFPVTMQMEKTHAGIFAEAHSILCWLDRYKFCPTCGNQQKVVEGGYKQICSNTGCSSYKGVHNTCYPRVDPSLIMLVVSPDKMMCLLGRQKRFPPKMYSCLAGFMEPGECIEDTCRREVEEESGVKVGRVDYHSSQPWPFPATLMLGCIAYARTDTITIDKQELEEARWFPRAEVAQMLAGQHPDGLFIPPKQAIAHQLIRTWVASSSSNL